MIPTKDQLSIEASFVRQRLLRCAEVKALTNIGKTKRNALIKAGLFPRPINQDSEHSGDLPRVGRTNYWQLGEVLDYLQSRIEARNKREAEYRAKSANHPLNALFNGVGAQAMEVQRG